MKYSSRTLALLIALVEVVLLLAVMVCVDLYFSPDEAPVDVESAATEKKTEKAETPKKPEKTEEKKEEKPAEPPKDETKKDKK